MSQENTNDLQIHGEVHTKRDEFSFHAANVYPNSEGNICIRLDDESHIILSPIMAKRLRIRIDEAIRNSIAMLLAED